MQKLFSFLTISLILFLAACDKYVTLPPYTPAISSNFLVSTLNHTMDSVNVGDTIYLTATGSMSDTTQSIYTFLTTSYSASGVNTVLNYGTAASPVKLTRTIGAVNGGLYTWTATILLPGATFVPHKTKLTIVGNFIYQLSLSSEQGTLSATDAGVKNKTVYVR
jgi:hypothetical protein